MKTITFKGKSELIETNGNFTSLVVSSYSDKIVNPLIHFVYLDGENDTEPLELNFNYEVLYAVAVYFETVQEHECTVTYQLIA
jgi:hypothetical protein